MSWLGKIDTTRLRVNVNTEKRFQGVRFSDDVTVVLEIQFQLINEVMVACCNRKVVDVDTEEYDFRRRCALIEETGIIDD